MFTTNRWGVHERCASLFGCTVYRVEKMKQRQNCGVGRFFCSPLRLVHFRTTADEIEVNPGSPDARDQLMPTYESWIVRRESWLPPF
jgi:hypothetical protein